MKKLIGKVFVREVKHEGNKFNVYTFLSAGGNWYGLKGDNTVLLKNKDKEILELEVSKMFEKEFTTKNGEVGVERNLIVETVADAPQKDIDAFIQAEKEANASTLKDVK